MCVSLAEDLYRTMMSIGYYGRLVGAPDILIKTMREIALSSLEKWRDDDKSMVIFAKEYLANKNFEWKSWELDNETAARLWKLQDLCEYIVIEYS